MRPPRSNSTQHTSRILLALSGLTLIVMLTYLGVRLTTLFVPGYSPVDAVMAILLFGAEAFLIVHGAGYFMEIVKASRALRRQPALFSVFPGRENEPEVAILVASFNESEDVLEATLASIVAMDYPAKRVYLLDDSTRPETRDGAARVAARYGARLVHRTDRSGYKAGAINDLLPHLTEPYIALLDADQRPRHNWLSDVVPHIEAHPDLAFVQTPQVSVTTTGMPVAAATQHQQAIFFEYISEGKSQSNAMFCCGTNVVLRREALLSIACPKGGRTHYFDEESVTEDFATSFRLHARGWGTDFVNQPYVFGMAPETLTAYFTQHMRWAMGTMGVGLQMARQLVRNPRALSPGQWWEYLLSGSYYFVGIANLIFLLAPVLFVAFDVRPLRSQSWLYLILFVPYIVSTMGIFLLGMRQRRYRLRSTWLATALGFATFWIYTKAAIVAVLGMKRAFGVTPKGVGGAIAVSHMLPELTLLLANGATAIAGAVYLLNYGWDVAYVMNTIWASYHTVLLSMLFLYFNTPVTIPVRRSLFESADPLAA